MDLFIIVQNYWRDKPVREFDPTYSEFMGRPVKKAPIITFYGKNRQLERTALHIHGVTFIQYFPYLYVKLPKNIEPDLYKLAINLEIELNKDAKYSQQIVHSMFIVEKIPFYGFHQNKSRFIKIEVYENDWLKRIGEVCLSGNLGFALQPYEAHIDVFEKLYCEYNLSGMDWMTAEKVWYRIPCVLELPKSSLEKKTHTFLEADTHISYIRPIEKDWDSKFGRIYLQPIYQIWEKEKERRSSLGLDMPEKMPKIMKNKNLPHDYIQSPEYAHELGILQALSEESGADTLCPNPSIQEEEKHEEKLNEVEEMMMDDIIDIRKPRGFDYTEKTYKFIWEKETLKNRQRIGRIVRRFSDEQVNWSEGETFEYKKLPLSYNEIECSVNYKTENQPLYVSKKHKKVLEGLTKPEILEVVNGCNEPGFAFKIHKISDKRDLSCNTYLYNKAAPPFHAPSIQEAPVENSVKFHEKPVESSLEITVLYLEVFVETRNKMNPNPEIDPIKFIACYLQDEFVGNEFFIVETGINTRTHYNKYESPIITVPNETSLIYFLIDYILENDPDIFISYEIEKLGLGYLSKRAKALNINFKQKTSRFIQIENKIQETLNSSRLKFSLWRIIKNEIKVNNYSFHTVVNKVFKKRLPEYSWDTLMYLFENSPHFVYDYFLEMIHFELKLLKRYNIFLRNINLARVYGIDFNSVFYRGSQFRVEAMMTKLIKKTDFLLLSAMPSQLRNQTELENIPLVIEPEKKLWTDPIVVLDFQSLYPSIIIAYNLCYSTCLGKLYSTDYKKFGVTFMKKDVYTNQQDVFIAPNNVGFVKPSKRLGILPLMLHELLQTRILIKNSLKTCSKNSTDYEMLQNEQLGIKLLCNTTYGYTGAGLTGRMPCNNIADSIVSTARKTLERAIQLVNNHPKWDAKVVYGDTDSLMVVLEGRTVSQAFEIGKEIAREVTESNPKPVTLVLEKVGLPMLTLAKKHYALYKWESPESKPVLECKGIYSVRRNGCKLAVNLLNKCLESLFETRDIFDLYETITKYWEKIHLDKIPLNHFIFHEKIYNLEGYKNLPPGVRLIKEEVQRDPMKIPVSGARVGYLVVNGEPGTGKLENIVSPEEFLITNNYKLHYEYYIDEHMNHVIDHNLGHIGFDIRKWYAKYKKPSLVLNSLIKEGSRSVRLDEFYEKANCFVCKSNCRHEICEACYASTQKLNLACILYMKNLEIQHFNLLEICRNCCENYEIKCEAIDCPVYAARIANSILLKTEAPKVKLLTNISW